MNIPVQLAPNPPYQIDFVRVLLGKESMSIPKYNYRPKQSYLSSCEEDFFRKITSIVRNKYFVFPQANLDKFITPNYVGGNIYALRHINQKSVDFLICDYSLRPLLAIELDDPTHLLAERQKRDKVVNGILANTGVPLVRIQGVDIPTNVIHAAIAKHINI